MSNSINSKSTKRFDFSIQSNSTAKQAGSNQLTISTRPYGDRYSTSTSTLQMTVKEAYVLQNFLNKNLL